MSNISDPLDDREYQLAQCINNCMTDEAFQNDNTLRTLIGMSDDSCRFLFQVPGREVSHQA